MSATIAKLFQLDRSFGISVFFTHVPLTKLKKSSPGGTDRSMPFRSRPWALVSCDIGPEQAQSTARAQAAMVRWFLDMGFPA